jgi:hypothetical protein
MTVLDGAQVAEKIRLAFAGPDLELLAPLLHPTVRWGDGPQPRACRSRADVLVTFARLLGNGVSGEVIDLQVLPGGVVAHLRVRWPDPHSPDARTEVWQSYQVEDGLITLIQGHDHADEARQALT